MVPSVRANSAPTRCRRAAASGVWAVPQRSIQSAAACWACCSSGSSSPGSATRNTGRPDWREPKKSPGPRSFRSSWAIWKPSLVAHRAFSRFRVSSWVVRVVRIQ